MTRREREREDCHRRGGEIATEELEGKERGSRLSEKLRGKGNKERKSRVTEKGIGEKGKRLSDKERRRCRKEERLTEKWWEREVGKREGEDC